MGVRDAVIRIVGEINSSTEDIFVHGPLIHNPQTISILDKRGLKTVEENRDIDGQTVAIRTHGIPYQRLKEIKKRARRLINLTCPRVARVQGIIKKYSRDGYFTLITGDDDHAEVISLKSYATSGVKVVSEICDIDAIPDSERYLVVSQTTFDRELFERIISVLTARFPGKVTIFNTICDSTYNRQEDVVEAVERGVDVLVVVGGKNSANTRRLADIGRDRGVRTFHIETESELDDAEFFRDDRVFVTAGASTPGWIINNILEKLYSIKYKKSNVLINLIKKFLEFIVRTNILSSAATFFITLFALAYSGGRPDPLFALTAAFYIFSMYTINNYLMTDHLKESNPYKRALYRQYRLFLLPLAALLMIASFVLISRYELTVIFVFVASSLLGMVYSTRCFKRMIELVGIRPLTMIYNSRNVAATAGWIIISALVPILHTKPPAGTALAILALIFCLIFFRNILLDLIAFQGDLILGRETLPIQVGIEKTRAIFVLLASFTLGAFGTVTILGGQWPHLIFAGTILYYLTLLFAILRLNYLVALKYELLVDTNLVLFILFYCVSSSLS